MENTSIHPRVSKGRAIHDKVNTAATPKNPLRGTLRKVTRRLEKRRHDYDLTMARDKTITGYHKPGSMKP